MPRTPSVAAAPSQASDVFTLLADPTRVNVIAGPCSVESREQLDEAAVKAAGADGLLIEVHPDPARALTDGFQSLAPEPFARVMAECRRIARPVDRTL